MSRAPNLLFVFADQMRGCDMGCAGNGDVHTPTMDRLATEGVRLTDCIATYPVCGPNRACLLTGTYAPHNGVLGNDLPLRHDLPTLGTVAREQGYRTGYIGKWHLDGVPRSKFTPPGPRRGGFDDYWAVYNCTHDYFRPRYYRDTPELIECEGYEPEVQTDLALDFLEAQAGADDPFCLVLSWGPPHDPYAQVPQSHRDRYDPAQLALRTNVQPEVDNPLKKDWDCWRTTGDYYAAITFLDEQLARLLDALDRLELAEDTVVVFTSDHGDMLWSHGYMKKQAPHEESIQVPWIIRWPGRIPANAMNDTLLGTVDVLPSLAGLLGWPIPSSVDGRDLSPALRNEPIAEPPTSCFIANMLSEDEGVQQDMPAWRGVRTATHTYAETADRQPWVLFDNKTDPHQMQNLAGSVGGGVLLPSLQRELNDWLKRADDPFLAPGAMLEHFGLTVAWEHRQRYRDHAPPADAQAAP